MTVKIFRAEIAAVKVQFGISAVCGNLSKCCVAWAGYNTGDINDPTQKVCTCGYVCSWGFIMCGRNAVIVLVTHRAVAPVYAACFFLLRFIYSGE